jgi:hypothetical protein
VTEQAKTIEVFLCKSALGCWVILRSDTPQYAWAGAHWTLHRNGLPAADFQVCNFECRDDAAAYARKQGFSVIEVLNG